MASNGYRDREEKEGDDRMMVLDAFWREFQAKEVALGPEHARTVEARQRAKLVFLLLRELQNYRTGKRTAGTSVTRRQSLRQLKKKGKPRGVIVLSSDDDDDGGEDGGEDEEYTGEVASTSKKALQTLPSLAALKRKASVGQQVQPTARDESSEKGGSTVASGGEGDEPLDEPSEDDEDEAGEAGEAGDGEDEEDEQMAEPGDEVDEEDEEDERMAEPDEDNGDVGMAALALDEPAPGERGGRRPPAAEESGGGKSDAMPHRKESRTEKRKPPMMAASSVSVKELGESRHRNTYYAGRCTAALVGTFGTLLACCIGRPPKSSELVELLEFMEAVEGSRRDFGVKRWFDAMIDGQRIQMPCDLEREGVNQRFIRERGGAIMRGCQLALPEWMEDMEGEN